MCTSTTWKLFDLNFHLLVSLGTPVFVLLFLIQIVAVKSYSLQISPRKCDLFTVYDSTVFRQQRVAALFHCGSLITFTDFCIFFFASQQVSLFGKTLPVAPCFIYCLTCKHSQEAWVDTLLEIAFRQSNCQLVAFFFNPNVCFDHEPCCLVT